MPIYEYLCLKCNLRFDWLLRAGSKEVSCPGCGSCQSHNCSGCFR